MALRKIVSLISKIKDSSNRVIIDELEKKGIKGIVPSHGDILFNLYMNNNRLTMKELSEKIKKTQPTVTVLVDKLIELELVTKEKSSDDGRVYYVTITEKGIEFKNCFFDISLMLNEIIQKNLTEDEANLLEKLLEKVENSF